MTLTVEFGKEGYETFTAIEFAARRRVRQDEAIEAIQPAVARWIASIDEPDEQDRLDALTELLGALYTDIYTADDGLRRPRVEAYITSLRRLFGATTKDSDPTTVATWLAVATLNAAGLQAAYDEPAPTVMRWTTMHDLKVRHWHAAAEGQRRSPGAVFHVGGENLRYPGDPRGRLNNTINCRCILQPIQLDREFAVTAAAKETTMSETTMTWHGVLAPEDEWSGDGRRFAAGSLRNRDLPLPLTWQKASSEGHDGSTVVGRIDSIERVDNMIRGEGVFIKTPETDEVMSLLSEFGRFGVSIDADDSEFEFDESTGQVTFNSARIASASLVTIPAFASAFIEFGTWAEQMWQPVDEEETECDPESPDYEECVAAKKTEKEPEMAPAEASQGVSAPALSLVASGDVLKAPAAWFADPQLSGPTHLTITEEGRVFGHIAEWTTCHIGYAGVCVSPPASASGYAYFATGTVLLDNGDQVRTGVISLGGGHASGKTSARSAAAHYDSTSAAVADVAVGEDEHGIWCAGWVRPGVSPEAVTSLRASDISGDWREFAGNMELIAALAVNVAGFPIAAVHNQTQVALVAAGVVEVDEPMAALVKAVVGAMDRREKMSKLRERVGA